VLVVDDEPAIRLLCRVNLELDGYRVLEAGSLDEARGTLAAAAVDAVLLDLHLGRERSYDLVRELTGGGTPVALLTGAVDAVVADSSGASAVLTKPFALEKLSETVQALLEAR
jgi:DNA-binding response OmpR family regulator